MSFPAAASPSLTNEQVFPGGLLSGAWRGQHYTSQLRWAKRAVMTVHAPERTRPQALPERHGPLWTPGVKGCAFPLPLSQNARTGTVQRAKPQNSPEPGSRTCVGVAATQPQRVPVITAPRPGGPTEAVGSHPSDSPSVRMGKGGEWEVSDHSRLGGFFFLEIYSGLLHLTPLIDREWLWCRKQKENVTGLLFYVLKD